MNRYSNFFYILFCGLFIVSAISSCSRENRASKEDDPQLSISLCGSESEMKMIQFLTSGYLKENPQMKMSLSGGGSSVGIEALISGNTDIANSSRAISEDELQRAEAKGIHPVSVIVAMDAISIITNPEARIDSLSIVQLAGLFSGKITNWKEVGGADLPVSVVGRNDNSGTYHYMLNHLHIPAFAYNTQVMKGNTEIVSVVARQKGAIGYVNLSSIYDSEGKPIKNIWVASIYFDGSIAYTPYHAETVISGEYPLSRPLYQYLNTPVSEKLKHLITYELSEKVQQQLIEQGYFPITPIHKNINTKNGF